jgi:predicted DNA-binding transcriptional regulator AlpA
VPELVTIDQAVEACGVSRATIFRMIKAGALKRYERWGSTATYVDKRALERLLKPRPAK